MNLKAIKGSYGDFGRVTRGTILKDIPRDRAEKLIASGAYVEASGAEVKGEKRVKAKDGPDAATAELEKLTNKQLQDLAAAEAIAVESDDNKAVLIEKIVAGRTARG